MYPHIEYRNKIMEQQTTIDTTLIEAVSVSYHTVNRKIDNEKYKYSKGDLCVIKQKRFDENGKVVKSIKLVENFKRPFWITKKQFRNHKDKREWVSLDEVQEYRSEQHNLSYAVQKALGEWNPDPSKQMRLVNRNPYVYGTDLTPSFLIKEAYNHKFKGFKTGMYDVCFLDIETDVLGPEDKRIICISLVLNDDAYLLALESFIGKNTYNYRNKFFELLDKDLPEVRGEFGYNVHLEVFQDEITMLKQVFNYLHAWKPDIVAGWNLMMFDQDVIAKRLVELGEDPAYYFSDPSVPDKYKNYRFKEGRAYMISDSGKKSNLAPIARWHEVIAPASFTWVDAMCVYYQLRKVKGMETSYRLDHILKKNIKRGKFEIEDASKYKGLAYHVYMQKEHPIYYCIYNLFDSVGLDRMDRKTNDLRDTFYTLLGLSDYGNYQSNPKKAVDMFYTYLRRNRNMTIGSTADKMFNEMDKELPPLSGWIVALPTVMLDDIGLQCIKQNEDIRTKFFVHCGDIDIESSYPWTGIYDNISRTTTEIEVAHIKGRTMSERYIFGLNLMGGRVNAMSNARIGFNLPGFVDTESIFDETFASFE